MLKFGKCFEIECFSPTASNLCPRGQEMTLGNTMKYQCIPVFFGIVCFCFENEAIHWETFFYKLGTVNYISSYLCQQHDFTS